MKKTIKYLQDGEYHYATVKDVGDLEQLRTKHKEDLVTALNELFTTGGNAKPTGYDDLVKKVNDTQTTVNGINNTITDINGKVVANDEAIAQAKKGLQDALTQFQTFNDEIEQAKKDAETKLANAKQALKDEFNANLADAQKANQKQLEDKVTVIQGNLDTTSNTLNDVKTQLANAKLDYGNVNVSIQKLNDMLSTKLSSTDLDPLRTSIQNQETEIQQTKDSIATKAGKAELDVLSGRVSNTEAKIKQQADEISLGVKKSELNGAIDNYQIEGTNRLRNTIDFDIDGGYWKLDRYSINLNTDVHPYDQAHDVSALVLQKAGSAKQDVDFTNEDLGQSFVVSMWNKKDAQPQVWYGNTQLTNRQVAEIKGDYERSFFTFIPTNVNVKTIMFKYDAGTVDQLVIGEPKLELGTKPKAYAPNPNDEHKQIVNTKAELKIASDKIESTVEKQTKTDNNVNQLSSRVTQTEQGITAANDLITKTKDGLIKDYTGKINASAKSLSSEFDEKTNEKIGQITDSGENLILNSAFTNESDRKDKWQNISDKVNIVADNNGLMWAHMSQTGLTADNPISLTSNYFPIKQGKITVGVDIKSDNTSGLSGAKILVLQTYNANKQRVDFTEISLENMGLTVQQLADGQSHRGVYRLGNDRSDAVYMTVKAVLPRNGSIYFTNFSAKLSSIDNGGYTPNAEDLKRQILNQKTKIEQNSQQITLKASSTELRDVKTIANGAVSVANQANSNASNAVNTANSANNKVTAIQTNGGGRNLLQGTRDFKQWGTSISKVAVTNGQDKFQAVTGTQSSSTTYYDIVTFGNVPLEKDTDYTASFWVKTSENTDIWSFLFDSGSNGNYADGAIINHVTTNYKRFVVHFHNGNNNATPNFIPVRIKKTGVTVWLYGCMLEKGVVAHEWQPAPEDIQSQIDQARTDIQSTLTVANNGITAATNLKTTYDNYVQKNDANIKLLGDRITNEVSKITSNGGGINLLTGSKTMHGVWSADGTSIFSADGYLAVRAIGDNMRIYQNPSEDTNGKLMSVSFDAEVLADSKNQSVQIWVGPFQAGVSVTISGNDFKRYKVESWKWNSANKAFSIQFKNANDKINIKNIKLEFGAVATPWSPAPEDTDSAIEAVSSKIDQTATSITSTVNSTKQDLQGQINSANTKITQTANSITEQLKSYSKTGDMQNYVNTTIQKTADGISAKVSGVESKVNGITSNGGGRNLLQGTGAASGDVANGGIGNNIVKGAFNGYDAIKTQHAWDERFINLYQALSRTNAKAGDWYTISVYVKADKQINTGSLDVCRALGSVDATTNDGPLDGISMQDRPITTQWQQYSWSFQINNVSLQRQNTRVEYNLDTGDNWIYWAGWMLEKGAVAHDWTPAPEDTNSAIQTTKADLVQQITDAKNAAIKVSKDSINSEVSDVRTTITQVNNKVDGVVSVANTANTTANSALTKANSATTVANQANNNASSANNNANQAINTANQANSKVDDIQANGGGRNLLHGTSGDWITKTATSWMNVTTANSNKTSVADYRTGDKFTYSAMVLNKSNVNVRLELYCCDNNGNRLNGDSHHALSDYVAPNTTAKRISCTITIDSNTWYVEHTLIADGGTSTSKTVQIKGEMFEYSTVAHDWSPAPEDVATDISNVNTKVEQYKTGIDQTATGMNLFAQVITGNKSIDVTKSNIGIDPNQIKIASNRIVIDGDTEFRGNSKWLDGKYINIEKLNYTASNTDYVDSVAFDSGGIIFSEYTRPTGTKTAPSSSNSKLGAVINVDYYQNKKVPGLSIVGNDVGMSAEPMGTTADPSSPVSHLLLRQGNFTLDAAQASGRGTVVGISGDITTGNLILDGNVELSSQNMTVQQGTAITVKATPTTQDKLMVVAQKNSNSTQDDCAQPTLRAGQSLTNLGDSGLTFYWNSVKAFGTFDLRDTHVLGNRNTHFSVETTFDTDGEANMCFTWTSRSDLWNNCKLPMLARADWWTSQWGSGGLGMANGNLFFFTNDGRTYRLIN